MFAQSMRPTRVNRFGNGGGFARARDGETLSQEIMRQAAPSIFAEDKHASRSEKFAYIPTSRIVLAMEKEGFLPVEVRQGGSRDDEKRGFTKHLIRFRHQTEDLTRVVGDSHSEIVLVNAHDGTSSYQISRGVYRLVCSNGMVVCEGLQDQVRVPHKGNIIDQVIEGSYRVINDSQGLGDAIRQMQAITLSEAEQNIMAQTALTLKYDDSVPSGLDASRLNTIRRRDDSSNDLWVTFNRIQENVMQGGVGYIERDENGRRKAYRHTRPVNSVDGNVKLNQALWAMAEQMKALKLAA